jgi:hypothetical protein
MKKILIIIIILSSFQVFAKDDSAIKLGRVKYSGGGDWYNDQSAEVNLLNFIKQNTNIPVKPVYEFVDLKTTDVLKYPILFMTGHGNINFSRREIENLKTYLENGGFLYIDDDYGMDEYIREEMKKVFPDKDFVEVPFEHEIYNIHYDFSNGPPKIHEHDDLQPKGYGLFLNGKLVVYYTYESNPSDGWADPEVHNDNPAIREEALKFGTNLVVWALTN